MKSKILKKESSVTNVMTQGRWYNHHFSGNQWSERTSPSTMLTWATLALKHSNTCRDLRLISSFSRMIEEKIISGSVLNFCLHRLVCKNVRFPWTIYARVKSKLFIPLLSTDNYVTTAYCTYQTQKIVCNQKHKSAV